MNPYVIAFLVLSILGNAGLGYFLKGAWEDKARLQSELGQAVVTAKSCSAGVAKIEQDAKTRQAKVEQALKQAQEQAKSAQHQAQKTLAVVASNTSNLCDSAASLSARKIMERKQK